MKRWFTLLTAFSLLLLASPQLVCAQGNLRFSQVKYVLLAGNILGGSSFNQLVASQNIVVPANHVLKIENIVGISQANAPYPGAYSLTFLVDGIGYSRATIGSTAVSYNQMFPVWLPAGTYTLKLEGSTANCAPCVPPPILVKAGLSGLDFEIIP